MFLCVPLDTHEYFTRSGRTPQESQTLRTCFYQIYEDALVFVNSKLLSKMTVLEAIYIRQTIDLLNGLLTGVKLAKPAHLEKLFIFALMWSLGALLELEDRIQLESFISTHKSRFGKQQQISRLSSEF